MLCCFIFLAILGSQISRSREKHISRNTVCLKIRLYILAGPLVPKVAGCFAIEPAESTY